MKYRVLGKRKRQKKVKKLKQVQNKRDEWKKEIESRNVKKKTKEYHSLLLIQSEMDYQLTFGCFESQINSKII